MYLFGIALSWYWNGLKARGAAMSTFAFVLEIVLIAVVAFGVLVLPVSGYVSLAVWLIWPLYFGPVQKGFEDRRTKSNTELYSQYFRAKKTRKLIDGGKK